MMLARHSCGWLLPMCLALSVGCGGSATPYLPPLDGTLTWEDGTSPLELEGGTIEFESQGKTVAQTGLRPDGTFILATALPAGEYRVRVLPPPANFGKPAVLDPRFESFEKSKLTFTATADGQQHANFKLARKRR
jgi:hypothetical protein